MPVGQKQETRTLTMKLYMYTHITLPPTHDYFPSLSHHTDIDSNFIFPSCRGQSELRQSFRIRSLPIPINWVQKGCFSEAFLLGLRGKKNWLQTPPSKRDWARTNYSRSNEFTRKKHNVLLTLPPLPLPLPMNLNTVFLYFIPIVLVCYFLFKLKHKIPPGPEPLPLMGNIPALLGSRKPLHVTLTDMARTHGPIITVLIGTQSIVIASTAESAMEILKNHNRLFFGRPIRMSFRFEHRIKYSLVLAECSEYWNLLRKIVLTEIFSPKVLQDQEHVREKKMEEMVEFLKSKEGEVLKLTPLVFGTLANVLGNVMYSKDVFGYFGDDGDQMQTLMKEMLMLGAAPNVAEFLPPFDEFDLRRLKKKCHKPFTEVMNMWKGTAEERKVNRNAEPKDVLDVLLAKDFNDDQINAIFLDTFGPGSETSSVTVEWAMAELIKNPKIIAKVREELDQVVGKSLVKESHMPNLPYLQACIKETMRLHPVAAFLVPHRSVKACKVMGYTIKKDIQVLVNVYAIGRNPKTWKDPTTFKPERFMESDIDYCGKHFEFIPFGEESRECVGMPLTTRTIPLIVSNLVHTIDWSLPDGKNPKELVINENLTMSMALDPILTVIPKARL